MKKLKHIYEHIVYVSGNHEFYNDKFTIDEIDFKLKNICDDLKIHYLQKDTWKHPATGVLFIGCTLWSDVFYEDVSLLNDYHKVFANDMYHWKSLHKDHQSWLQETIEMHKDVPIFVITHHLPSFLCIDEKLKGKSGNTGYASHSDYLFKSPVIGWICGHSHDAIDTQINNIPIRSDPIGYKFEYLLKNKKNRLKSRCHTFPTSLSFFMT